MLSLKHWQDQQEEFKRAGIRLPQSNVATGRAAGKAQPRWVHVGGGNLYRAFHAEIAQDLLDQGKLDRGVVVLQTRSPELVNNAYEPFNDDILQVVMRPDGTLGERVLSSTASALFANPQNPTTWGRALEYFRSSDLELVTVTITEKGYALHGSDGKPTDAARRDFNAGPTYPQTAMGIVTALLDARFEAGAVPLALVSTDNFSRNGEHFRAAVLEMAHAWQAAGFVSQGFVDYVADESRVSFPWTMIDRITPAPSPETAAALEQQGFDDLALVKHGHSCFAGFANTEEAHYLVVEDSFPNGRPALEDAGVILCDRHTAELADTMKVTACLNPLHTCLAVYGCLLGYTRIWQEMEDADLVALIRHLGYDEDLPVVEDPKVINPKAFLDELLTKRLPNKSLPDAPQRIATDTSQKIPVRYGHTLKAYASNPGKDPARLMYIPLAIAGWLRYLLGVDDKGQSYEPSPDPLLGELQTQVKTLFLGCTDPVLVHEAVSPILHNKEIFVCDLYQIGLGEKVEHLLLEELAGPGAVRATIERYL